MKILLWLCKKYGHRPYLDVAFDEVCSRCERLLSTAESRALDEEEGGEACMLPGADLVKAERNALLYQLLGIYRRMGNDEAVEITKARIAAIEAEQEGVAESSRPAPYVGVDAKDAARYRWLRDKYSRLKTSASQRVLDEFRIDFDPVASLDDAIDSALSQQKENEG